jgi:hypothetical protein
MFGLKSIGIEPTELYSQSAIDLMQRIFVVELNARKR